MSNNNMRECPLFEGVEDAEIDSLLSCLGAKRRTYKKDAFIFRVDDPAQHVGIVLSGGANVIQEDFWGNRAIMMHVGRGDLFGEAFSCGKSERLPVSVIATEASEIMLIDCRKIVATCTSACVFHVRLISNMLQILANKNLVMTNKMGFLSQRTTREKLLSFLSAQAVNAKSREVTIPYNRQELADYLCVERSALSRELTRMKADGLLDYDKNRFTLC